MSCSKQHQLCNETGLLRALFTQVFKTFKMEMTLPPLAKFGSVWLSSWWKKISLRWSRLEKKQAGNEVPTRCYRWFTANSGMLLLFLTSTGEVSHEAFPLLLQLSRLSCSSPIWWSLPGKCRQLALSFPPCSCPSPFLCLPCPEAEEITVWF